MSDLRPTGVPVEIEGVERHLLFTLNVIDDIQEHFNMGLAQVINRLADEELHTETLRYVLRALLNDEAERSGGELKQYTDKEIGWIITLDNQIEIVILILKAYGISLPEAEDGEIDPNQMSGQMEG